jgi:ABC-2 type transport system ATP-binding protein
MTIVVVEHLTKSYGELKAVDDFSFDADEGEIVALVGPDGAGKTSLFRAVCGLIEFDNGRAIIAGNDIATDFDLVKPDLGYMPQSFSLYPDLSVEENLRFYAGLFGLNKGRFDEKKNPLYDFSGLGPFRKRRAGNLSGGMKQKLALSCALIHDPKVLILDEPTTGVDPLSRRQFWDILKELQSRGSTIIVSTPYMDEVALADRAIFMHQGLKLAEGTPEELARLYDGHVYRIQVEPTTRRMQQLQETAGIEARRFGAALHIYTGTEMGTEKIKAILKQIGIEPERAELIPADLEDAFIQLMGQQ